MAHDRTSDDGVRAVDRDLGVGDLDSRNAVLAGGDVAEVAGVALLVARGAVGLAGGVEVRAGREAAVGGVAQLVDVEAVLARREAGDLAGDSGATVGRGEGDDARDAGGADKNADLRTDRVSASQRAEPKLRTRAANIAGRRDGGRRKFRSGEAGERRQACADGGRGTHSSHCGEREERERSRLVMREQQAEQLNLKTRTSVDLLIYDLLI